MEITGAVEGNCAKVKPSLSPNAARNCRRASWYTNRMGKHMGNIRLKCADVNDTRRHCAMNIEKVELEVGRMNWINIESCGEKKNRLAQTPTRLYIRGGECEEYGQRGRRRRGQTKECIGGGKCVRQRQGRSGRLQTAAVRYAPGMSERAAPTTARQVQRWNTRRITAAA